MMVRRDMRKRWGKRMALRLLHTRLMVSYYELLDVEMLTIQVSNADQVQKRIADVVKDFGKVDVFVANAGESFDPKEWSPGYLTV